MCMYACMHVYACMYTCVYLCIRMQFVEMYLDNVYVCGKTNSTKNQHNTVTNLLKFYYAKPEPKVKPGFIAISALSSEIPGLRLPRPCPYPLSNAPNRLWRYFANCVLCLAVCCGCTTHCCPATTLHTGCCLNKEHEIKHFKYHSESLKVWYSAVAYWFLQISIPFNAKKYVFTKGSEVPPWKGCSTAAGGLLSASRASNWNFFSQWPAWEKVFFGPTKHGKNARFGNFWDYFGTSLDAARGFFFSSWGDPPGRRGV